MDAKGGEEGGNGRKEGGRKKGKADGTVIKSSEKERIGCIRKESER